MVAILTQHTIVSFNAIVVGGVKAISGIGSGSASAIDMTTLASTAKESVPGLRDFGAIKIDLLRDQTDAGQLAIFSSLAGQETHTLVITLTSSVSHIITCSCYIQNLTTEIPADGVVMGSATLKITGPIVYT
jgi:hypothetical protein